MTSTVHEMYVPYCLAISHDENRLPGGGYAPLARELIGVDEGVIMEAGKRVGGADLRYVYRNPICRRIENFPSSACAKRLVA